MSKEEVIHLILLLFLPISFKHLYTPHQILSSTVFILWWLFFFIY